MEFKDCVIKSYPTGSRYICNPPPKDTDNDTVILVNGFYNYVELLVAEDFSFQEGEYQDGDFQSWRKGEENYIITEDEDFFLSYVYATEGARALNLLKKEDRITLFNAVCTSGKGYRGLQVQRLQEQPRGFARIWDRLNPDRLRWEQAVVVDGGRAARMAMDVEVRNG